MACLSAVSYCLRRVFDSSSICFSFSDRSGISAAACVPVCVIFSISFCAFAGSSIIACCTAWAMAIGFSLNARFACWSRAPFFSFCAALSSCTASIAALFLSIHCWSWLDRQAVGSAGTFDQASGAAAGGAAIACAQARPPTAAVRKARVFMVLPSADRLVAVADLLSREIDLHGRVFGGQLDDSRVRVGTVVGDLAVAGHVHLARALRIPSHLVPASLLVRHRAGLARGRRRRLARVARGAELDRVRRRREWHAHHRHLGGRLPEHARRVGAGGRKNEQDERTGSCHAAVKAFTHAFPPKLYLIFTARISVKTQPPLPASRLPCTCRRLAAARHRPLPPPPTGRLPSPSPPGFAMHYCSASS